MYGAGGAMLIVGELWVCAGRGYMGTSVLFAQWFHEPVLALKSKADLQ